ncbi:MAG: class I SAM-dependent methyltransferase [Alphaproteobacteria bacterium]|nr:class I SAM-dependent methyltransferase [Alphaproteobacteria bacterium]
MATRPWGGSGAAYRECRSCQLVTLARIPNADELDRMYADYYSEENIAHQTTEMESSDTALHAHAKFLAARVLKPGMRVLDFGAGIGTLGQALKQYGFETEGLEHSAGARETARARFGIELYATVDQLEKGRYDLIVMVEVIEHLTAPWETLRTLRECLAPGGRIYVTTPNRNGLQARLHGARWREAKPFHLMLFNAHALSRMLGDCGFADTGTIRFSPLTTDAWPARLVHRCLQAVALYGGLRMLGTRADGAGR